MTTITQLSELTGDYVLDPARTTIGFVGRHTMATRVRGRFDAFAGHARLDGEDPSRSSVGITIEAASLRTRDDRRDQHLRRRFLHADEHPAIAFTSTRVERAGGNTFVVTGDLTIRGVSRPVTVEFELTGPEPSFTGRATINRRDWGVNWNAATALLLEDAVVLELEVRLVRHAR
ncbi:YceI family protein [Nonomuraea soli]|uniref:Polyisoprenoid-binding protein YceI n=1 Tax=Nonomuraea soli TaxID=1032476 RepID=A0A7W0CQK1_9ACTN|nr:YceI family protein [Nonomuraea soli]MBA2895513.1 polyisoprenoid-binding protein YceI [Nonomuraea soli]